MTRRAASRVGSWAASGRRWLMRPRVTLALLTLCMIDLFTLAPGHQYEQAGSTVANFVGSLREPMLRHDPFPSDRPAVLLGWIPATDEVRRVSKDEAGVGTFFEVYSSFSSAYSGWWGLTRDTRTYWWQFMSWGSQSPPGGTRERVGDAFVEYVRSLGDPFWTKHVELGVNGSGWGYSGTRPLWAGWARNALSLTLWGLLLASFGWCVTPALERRRWRRFARGICPRCRYDLRASGDRPCPECGLEMSPQRPRRAGAVRGPTLAGWLQRPWVTALLGAVLAGDAVLLPKGQFGRGSWVANQLPFPAIRTDRGDGRPNGQLPIAVFITDEGPEMRLVNEGGGETASGAVCSVSVHHSSFTKGFWAPVRVYSHRNYGGVGWEQLPDAYRAEFSKHLLALLEGRGLWEWAEDVRFREASAGYEQRVLWGSHAHNALAMAAALALCISLGWIPRRVRGWVRRRRAPRDDRHDRCGYCLAQRDAGADQCPVCGTCA